MDSACLRVAGWRCSPSTGPPFLGVLEENEKTVCGALHDAVGALFVRPRSQYSLKPFDLCAGFLMVAAPPNPLLMLTSEVQRILSSASLSHSESRSIKGGH